MILRPRGDFLDFMFFREAAGCLFGKHRFAIEADLENTASALDQLDLSSIDLREPVAHTERPRFVVSNEAVFNPELHSLLLIKGLNLTIRSIYSSHNYD